MCGKTELTSISYVPRLPQRIQEGGGAAEPAGGGEGAGSTPHRAAGAGALQKRAAAGWDQGHLLGSSLLPPGEDRPLGEVPARVPSVAALRCCARS